MEQEAVTQAPMEQDQLKLLTDLVQQLLRERNNAREPEDPHVTTRIPVTDLTVYPELIEALLSIEEDFLRSPLTEEERKIAINSCPKTSSMNCYPPPLKDSASSAVKKADSVLYGIQLALAQATRPIDYYVHRRIHRIRHQTADGSRGFERPHCKEADDKITTGIALSVPTLMPAPIGPQTANQILAERVASAGGGLNKDPEQPPPQIPFTNPKTPTSNPPSEKTEIDLRNQQVSDGGSRLAAVKTCDRGNQTTESWIFQSAVHDPQEDRCIYAHYGVQEMQEVSEHPMEQTFVSVPRLAIRAITEPVGIHQDSPSGSGVGQSKGDPNICIPRRSADPGRDQASMRNQNVLNLFQTLGAWIQGQFREVLNNAIPVNHTSRNETRVSSSLGAQEQSAVHIEVIDIKGNSDKACNPEPAVLEEPTGVMERAVILARKTRARDLYRLQRHSMWNCCGSPLILWSLEHTIVEDSHECKKAIDGTLCSEAQEGRGHIGVSLFRQHNHTLVNQEVRMDNLLRIIGNLRAYFVTLPENQNPPTSNIRTVTSEPSG
ncbi:hypothetical protein AYI69_g2339 [Smittium culicis]|uniref:Uncharacterized protein n=1 Tax=Smittium culicis TaxID=133412 RepID=A0A1R1YN87_9FUNG|nr:hypothetical protein AYI69_g2339 [Smittium culicis]